MAGDEKKGYTIELDRTKITIGLASLVVFAVFFIGVGDKLNEFSTAKSDIVKIDARITKLENALLSLPTIERDVKEMRQQQKENDNSINNLTKMMLAEFGNTKALIGAKEQP